MNNKLRGTSFRSARVLIAIALASMMLAGGSTALAGGHHKGGHHKPVFVSGNAVASDCGLPGSDWAIALTGDLEGCWSAFTKEFKCLELDDYDLGIEKGREIFVGTYKGQQGRLRTTYTVEAAYAKGFCQSLDFTLEVAGGCLHKIFGTSGVFDHAKGLIKFLDVITGVTGDPVTGEFQAGTGGNNFPYYGHIDFGHGH
jgi:hypothetical protein